MGSADKLREHLPSVLNRVKAEGRAALWVCDPVHGNTYTSSNGFKTRDVAAIKAEIQAFFDVHEQCGTWAGGVHLEMTGKDVTECVGGVGDVTEESLKDRYQTYCDPRLNGQQALELSFLIAERMRKRIGLPP